MFEAHSFLKIVSTPKIIEIGNLFTKRQRVNSEVQRSLLIQLTAFAQSIPRRVRGTSLVNCSAIVDISIFFFTSAESPGFVLWESVNFGFYIIDTVSSVVA